MLKLAALFLLMVGLISFHVQLIFEKKAFLLKEQASSDGWRHSCLYYKPFSVVTVSRPVQSPCPRYDSLP